MKVFINWFKNNKVISIPTAIWLLIGLIALIIHWVTYDGINWVVLSGFATWVLAAGIAVTIWQIIISSRSNIKHLEASRKSIDEARRSTNAQIVLDLYKQLRDDTKLKILREIYSLKRGKDGKCLISNSNKDKIDTIIDTLGLVGALIYHKIIDEKLAIESFGGGTAIRCWYQLGDYIKETRGKRGLQYGSYFEDFASRALEHFNTFNSGWFKMYQKHTDISFDLINRFKENEQLQPKRFEKQADSPIKNKPENKVEEA